MFLFKTSTTRTPQTGNIVAPKNTLVAGTATVQGERLAYWCPRLSTLATSSR